MDKCAEFLREGRGMGVMCAHNGSARIPAPGIILNSIFNEIVYRPSLKKGHQDLEVLSFVGKITKLDFKGRTS